MELILEAIGHIVFNIVFGFFGAIAGLLWTPQNRAWARARIAAVVLFLSAITTWIIACFIDQRQPFWLAILLGLILFISFLAVGNICRRHHENQNKKNM